MSEDVIDIRNEFEGKHPGKLTIEEITVSDIKKEELLEKVKEISDEETPITMVCCTSGFARSRFVARYLYNKKAVNLCLDHFIDDNEESTDEVQGVRTPWKFEPSESGAFTGGYDSRAIEFLIICEFIPTNDKEKRKFDDLKLDLKIGFENTRPDYKLPVLILKGSEQQFHDVFVGESPT